MTNKKTLFLILATLATIVLAVIAVVTSMRLKELATVPVAPNVPVSQPKAQTALTPNSCQITFTVAEEEVPLLACYEGPCTSTTQCQAGYVCLEKPNTMNKVCLKEACPGKTDCICTVGLSCVAKNAYKGNSTTKLASEAVIARGDTIVFEIVYENTGDTANTVDISDVISAGYEFVSADAGCSYEATTKKVTCTDVSVASKTTGSKKFTVKVAADAVIGLITNKADLTPASGTASSCSIALKVEVTATATPTPTPTPTPAQPLKCNDYCANTDECPSGFKCEGNKCRNVECTGDNDCNCDKPPGCNEACNPDNLTNECVGGYTCDRTTKTCRNSACTGETDCTCEVKPTVKASVEQLPTAGSPVPGFLFLGAGALLLILGVLAVGL